MGIRSKIGETVVELHQLRRRNAELEIIARRVPILERLVRDLEAEILQLRRQVYSGGKIKRQTSGRRAHEPENVA
jgi:hypothetical protein